MTQYRQHLILLVGQKPDLMDCCDNPNIHKFNAVFVNRIDTYEIPKKKSIFTAQEYHSHLPHLNKNFV